MSSNFQKLNYIFIEWLISDNCIDFKKSQNSISKIKVHALGFTAHWLRLHLKLCIFLTTLEVLQLS